MKIKHLLILALALVSMQAQAQEPVWEEDVVIEGGATQTTSAQTTSAEVQPIAVQPEAQQPATQPAIEVQAQGGISGTVVIRTGRNPIEGAKVTLTPGGLVRYTEHGGLFSFEGLPEGQYTISVEVYEFEDAEVNVRVAETVREITIPMISTVSIDGVGDLDAVDLIAEGEGGDDIQYSASTNLSSSRDLFTNIAGYKFSEMRFNARGLRNETIFLNGVEFNDAMTGYSPWSLWTGLNDATRNQESQAGAGAFTYGLGGMNGNTNINARASQMRQGFRGSLAGGTNSYLMRVMATYASGMLDNGWSYAFSASTRQGRHAWVDGVYYNTWGWFASVEKRFRNGHTLSLTGFGTPTQRGAQAASTDEVYGLTGNNFYNPNWGYQDGKMRNSRVRNNHEPVVMLNYTWDNADKGLTFNAAASYRFGRNGYSALDWYNSADPRPDYYRKLPSFYSPMFGKIESEQFYALQERWWGGGDPKYTQIDWDNIININRRGRVQSDGVVPDGVDPMMDSRSYYIIEERRTDQNDLQFTGRLEHRFSPSSKMTYGLNYRWNRTEYFKVLKDLLGGDYFIDLDNFADRDFAGGIETQNDLARPNRAVFEGDKFGYDYYAHLQKGNFWAMYNLSKGSFNFYAAAEVGYTSLWREGLVEKGLFPNFLIDYNGDYVIGDDGRNIPVDRSLRSKGESERKGFLTYKGKIGASYSFFGAHNIALNVAYDNAAPYFQNAFMSPRTRNEVTPGLTTSKTFAVDLTYNMRYSWGRFRLSGFFMLLNDQSKVLNFYDDTNKTFTNFAMSGVDQRHIGMEFAAQIPIAYGISFNTAVSLGDYVYTSNPRVTQTVDNSAVKELENAEVYYKGLYVESTPQFAANVGLSYRSENNWFAGIDVNMYDWLYLSMNPLFRTDRAFKNMFNSNFEEVEPGIVQNMMSQEEFPFAFSLNANVGKMWYLSKGSLGVSIEGKNLLNNLDIKTGGYEQSRLWRNTDNPDAYYSKYPSKYFYMYGINFYINVYYRF